MIAKQTRGKQGATEGHSRDSFVLKPLFGW